jgi:hypothetical protein
MFSNRLAFGALGVACIAAAAGGGYLASRQNTVPAPLAATSGPAPAASPDRPAPAVQETEAVVGDTKAAAPEPQASATSPKPASTAKRAEPAPKPAARNAPPGASARTNRPAANNTPGTLASSWPSSQNGQTSTPSASAPVDTTNPAHPADSQERAAQEPPRAPEPPQKTFEELVVSADSVVGLQTENRVSSDTARVEDRVDARVTRDVKVGDRVAIPAGTKALGNVTLVERGGKFKERARLGIRFHTLVLADGTQLPISTETIYREGDAPSTSAAQKVGGGAVGGAILGAILGGAKGAAIGAAAGAGGGTAVVAAGDRSNAVVQPGSQMTVRIISPVTITQEKEN